MQHTDYEKKIYDKNTKQPLSGFVNHIHDIYRVFVALATLEFSLIIGALY